MAGVVVVAGIFEPGSVATLVEVQDEGVMRPPEGAALSRRLVDGDGNVGFDDLEIGGRYFVTGYVNGLFVMVRAIGVDAAAPDTELMQAPVGAEPQTIGTQQERAADPPPEPPADAGELETGVPAEAEAANPIVAPEDLPEPAPADLAPPVGPDVPAQEPVPSESAGEEQKVAAGASEVTVTALPDGATVEGATAPPEAAPEAAPAEPAPEVPAQPADAAVSPAVDPPAADAAPADEVADAPQQDAGAEGAPASAAPVDPSAPVQEPPAPEAAPADAPAPVDAPEAAPAVADAPTTEVADAEAALQAQAAGLGIETANLTVDQLRALITGRGATPAA